MAAWSDTTKHLPSTINSGNQYNVDDDVSLQELNALAENAFYAARVAENAQAATNNGISYDAQTPTSTEQTQARQNIGALSSNPSDLSNITSWNAALGLTHIGQIIITTSSTYDPAAVYGGTWEQLTDDAYLKIATGTAIGALNGTSSEHKIPVSSMPNHEHYSFTTSEGYHYLYYGSPASSSSTEQYGKVLGAQWDSGSISNGSATLHTSYTGGNGAYYPYYYGVKVWRRTA